jgi:hypothetical protein
VQGRQFGGRVVDANIVNNWRFWTQHPNSERENFEYGGQTKKKKKGPLDKYLINWPLIRNVMGINLVIGDPNCPGIIGGDILVG